MHGSVCPLKTACLLRYSRKVYDLTLLMILSNENRHNRCTCQSGRVKTAAGKVCNVGHDVAYAKGQVSRQTEIASWILCCL